MADNAELGELGAGLKTWFRFYNEERLHQSIGYATPDEMYFARMMME